jgi:recombination protein RecT
MTDVQLGSSTSATLTAVGTAVNKPPIVILRERLEARKDELAKALTDVTPDQFIRALVTSAQINPELQAVTWQSLWMACMQACRDGLLPDGVEGAIVPFKSRATWIPMYQGLLRRFRRSGQFKWVTANVVREGEEFAHHIDEQGEHFRHVPGDDFNAPIAKVYAMATTKDGGVFVNVMSIAEANKIRNMSRASRDDSPWKQWPEEMYKKTALRRLSKVLPSGRDIIGDEELPEPEAPTTSPPPIARAPGAAAALEQFSRAVPAGDNPHPVSADDAGQEGEERDTDQSAATAAIDDPAPADDNAAHLAIMAAFKTGQEAKRQGHQRKALPGLLRDPTRSREALAWTAGWEGEPMPEFFATDQGER